MSSHKSLPNADDVEAQRGATMRSEHKHDGDNNYGAGDEAMVVNFFDYLASSAVSQAEGIQKLSAAILGSDKASSRRRSQQVRPKQYSGDMDETTNDTKEDPSVSGPAHVGAYQSMESEVSLDMKDKGSNKLRRAPSPPPVHEEIPNNNYLGAVNDDIVTDTKNGQKQRYTIEIIPPSAMVSSGSDDSDEDIGECVEDAVGSFPAASPRALSRADSSSSGSSRIGPDSSANWGQNIYDYNETNGVLNDLEIEQAGNQAYSVLPSDSEISDDGRNAANEKQDLGVSSLHDVSHGMVSYAVASSDEDAIQPSKPFSQFVPSKYSSPPTIETKASASIPSQQSPDPNAIMMASLAGKVASKRRSHQQREDQIETERSEVIITAESEEIKATDLPEDPLEASKRRHEDIQRRRREALAIAAAACHRRESLTHRELPQEKKNKPEPVKPHRLVELKSVSSMEGSSRRLELEKRKRDLEAAASKNHVSFSPLSEHHPTIDVYTGEEIDEMPKIETVFSKVLSQLPKELSRRSSNFDDESSSEFTDTVYDLPVRKTGTTTGTIIFAFLLIGAGLGVYFGLFFE